MANSDNMQRLIVYITAAILAIGAPALAVYVWQQPSDPTKDFALIFGFLGTVFGGASTFLFLGERSTAQAISTTRAVDAGGALGAQMPQGANGFVDMSGLPDAVEDEFDPEVEDDVPAATGTVTSDTTPQP